MGYITGVAYIRNCVARPANLERSRYLTETAETMKPSPRPKIAIWKTKSGSKIASIRIPESRDGDVE